MTAGPKLAGPGAAAGAGVPRGDLPGSAASLPPSGPVAGERLLELQRARSILTVDLVQWPNGKLSVSLGFTPLSDRNPLTKTRYVNVDASEISRVIAALETAGAVIQQERETEAAP